MCFSAEASFTAAALLMGAGGVLINRFKDDKTKIFLALIPFFFGLQQLSEGILWTAFNYGAYGSMWSYAAQYSFMFFAYLFWPVWIPFSYLMSEKVPWRKYVMTTCLILGMAFYCYLIFEYFTMTIEPAKVVNNSIVYIPGSNEAKLVYLLIVLIPIFVSSIPRMMIVGFLTGFSFIIADYLYTYAYASVWCFASGLIFLGLYFVLKREK